MVGVSAWPRSAPLVLAALLGCRAAGEPPASRAAGPPTTAPVGAVEGCVEWPTTPASALVPQIDGAAARVVAFAPDGRVFATSAGDGAVRVWDGETAELRVVLRAHRTNEPDLAFDPTSRRLLGSAGLPGIDAWSLDDGSRQRLFSTTEPVAGISVASDGDTIATEHGSGVRLWTRSGAQVAHFAGRHGRAAFSPDGRRVVTWDSAVGARRSLAAWDVGNGRTLWKRPGGEGSQRGAPAWVGEGNEILWVSDARTVEVLDAATGAVKKRLRPPGAVDLRSVAPLRAGGAPRVVVSDGGERLAVIELASGRSTASRELPHHLEPVPAPGRAQIAVADRASHVVIVDADSPDLATIGRFVSGAFAWAPSGARLAVGASHAPSATALVEGDARRLRRVATVAPAIVDLAIAAGGRELLTVQAAREGWPEEVFRWELATGRLLPPLPVPSRERPIRVEYRAVVAGGARIAASDGELVDVWRDGGFERSVRIEAPLDGAQHLALSPDGAVLASTGSAGHRLRLVRLASGEVTDVDLDLGRIASVAFDPGGARVAVGLDRHIAIVDVASASVRSTTERDFGGVSAMAWVQAELLIAGTRRGRLARVEVEGDVHQVDAHVGPVRDLALSPDGRRLVSGGEDRALRVWDASTLTPGARHVVGGAPVLAVAWHPAGTVALAASDALHAARVDGAGWVSLRALHAEGDRVLGLAVGPGDAVGGDPAAAVWLRGAVDPVAGRWRERILDDLLRACPGAAPPAYDEPP